jgi:hypothetical protein
MNDRVVADGGHLRQRHGNEGPHDDEDEQRDKKMNLRRRGDMRNTHTSAGTQRNQLRAAIFRIASPLYSQ